MTELITETDVARAISRGEMDSPQRFGNMWLFDLRITGTGVSYRPKYEEAVYRPPEQYLNDEFLTRCNGLPVLIRHTQEKALNHQEFIETNVGSICFPYIKNDEVWGVARIYDEEAAHEINKNVFSTSPNVIFTELSGNIETELKDGTPLLIEGKPVLIDHLAFCDSGVWDKGGSPSGINSKAKDNNHMDTDVIADKKDSEGLEPRASAPAEQAENAKLDKVLEMLMGLHARIEKMEGVGAADNMPAAPLPVADSSDDKETEDKKEEPKADEASDKKECAKADSAEVSAGMKKEIMGVVKDMMPRELSEDDRNIMAEAQAKADSISSALGQRTPHPMIGESSLSYRKRLLNLFKKYSDQYKEVNLTAISDAKLLDIAEAKIYADASAAAMRPTDVPKHTLREVVTKTDEGHTVRKFYGETGACWDVFKPATFQRGILQKQ